MPPLALAGISIALWASLAYLSTLVSHVPPFLLVGLTLLVGSLPGLPRVRSFTRDPRVLALGVYGLFGYHFCLFLALRTAPAVEANLINYLWPVLIVAFSPPLRWYHWAGAALAFAGAALIATGGDFTSLSIQPGLLLALATHAVLEPHVALTAHDAGVIAALGVGLMGAAFYCWDAALKRGDPRRIGALSYLTPLLSTSCLVVVGGKPFTGTAALAMVLIIAGAALGGLRASVSGR